MSDRAKNHALILLGIVTALITVFTQIVKVGEIKGIVETKLESMRELHAESASRLTNHERRIADTEGDVKALKSNVSSIESRLHGIASQVGKVPAKVAAKLSDTEPPKN